MDKLNKKHEGMLFLITTLLIVMWLLAREMTYFIMIVHSLYIISKIKIIKKESFEFYSFATIFYLISCIIFMAINKSGFLAWVVYFAVINIIIIAKNIKFNKYLMIGSSFITIAWVLASIFLKASFLYYDIVLIEYLIMQLNNTCDCDNLFR